MIESKISDDVVFWGLPTHSDFSALESELTKILIKEGNTFRAYLSLAKYPNDEIGRLTLIIDGRKKVHQMSKVIAQECRSLRRLDILFFESLSGEQINRIKQNVNIPPFYESPFCISSLAEAAAWNDRGRRRDTSKQYVKILRISYKEPYQLNLAIEASNGNVTGHLVYYCNASDLLAAGNALSAFPSRIPDEYLYELGTETPEDQFAFHFKMRVYTFDSAGHCAIQFRMNNNSKCPEEEVSEFSILADPMSINRLGELLRAFSELKHTSLVWNIDNWKVQ